MASKYQKKQLINMLVSALFIVSGSYLAMMYYLEHPDLLIHWEGIIPLLLCLVFFIFF